ncbi:MAG: Rieske 2Fe-2S domain-containing protein [Acidimicrobiales bacterium]
MSLFEATAMADPGGRAEGRAAVWFVVSTVASIALAVVYASGGQPQAEGILLALVSGGIGMAIVTWAKHSLPHGEVTEDRHSVASSEADVEAFTEALVRPDHLESDDADRAGQGAVGRRRLLVAAAGAAFTAFGAALLFPIRSLGPRPGKDLRHTPYDGGTTRVVTEDGQPVKVSDLPVDGVITVWPEGHTDAADAPTLLIRTRNGQGFTPRPGRDSWTVDGIVAYSKLCTHVGCPVGLYQAEAGLLLCPCHQSTFNVLDGARPIFGPAARSLPQLPLAVNDDDEIVATGDFDSPVGPGYWDRDR